MRSTWNNYLLGILNWNLLINYLNIKYETWKLKA